MSLSGSSRLIPVDPPHWVMSSQVFGPITMLLHTRPKDAQEGRHGDKLLFKWIHRERNRAPIFDQSMTSTETS